jgi:hypothetical protein
LKEVFVFQNFKSSRKFKTAFWILFASFSTFAIGHGCSATGAQSADSSNSSATSSATLTLDCYSSSLAYSGTAYCDASGGTSPYSMSLYSGGGSINSSTNQYTAPTYDTTAQIQVVDASGAKASYIIYVSSTATSTSTSGKTAVYRFYDSTKGYYYSTSSSDGTSAGYGTSDGISFYLLSSSVSGTHVVYKCQTSSGLNFLSLQYACESSGSVNQGIMGYAYDSAQSGTILLNRYHWYDSKGTLRTFAIAEASAGTNYLIPAGYALDGPIGYGFSP